MEQIKVMHAKGRGVIGMKICGNGTFTSPADREKSIRFAMSHRKLTPWSSASKTARKLTKPSNVSTAL